MLIFLPILLTLYLLKIFSLAHSVSSLLDLQGRSRYRSVTQMVSRELFLFVYQLIPDICFNLSPLQNSHSTSQ